MEVDNRTGWDVKRFDGEYQKCKQEIKRLRQLIRAERRLREDERVVRELEGELACYEWYGGVS